MAIEIVTPIRLDQVLTTGTDNDCPLCFLPLVEQHHYDTQLLDHPCENEVHHIYHRYCFSNWLSKNNICPSCRTQLQYRENPNFNDDAIYVLKHYSRINELLQPSSQHTMSAHTTWLAILSAMSATTQVSDDLAIQLLAKAQNSSPGSAAAPAAEAKLTDPVESKSTESQDQNALDVEELKKHSLIAAIRADRSDRVISSLLTQLQPLEESALYIAVRSLCDHYRIKTAKTLALQANRSSLYVYKIVAYTYISKIFTFIGHYFGPLFRGTWFVLTRVVVPLTGIASACYGLAHYPLPTIFFLTISLALKILSSNRQEEEAPAEAQQ